MEPFKKVEVVTQSSVDSKKLIDEAKSLTAEIQQKITKTNAALDKLLQEYLVFTDLTPEDSSAIEDGFGPLFLRFQDTNGCIGSLKEGIKEMEASGSKPELVEYYRETALSLSQENSLLLERLLALKRLLDSGNERSH